ncbi:MAG: aminoglycoside 3'-phosphotransferase [Clostridia bacterium]|nr:aminoglycoside 3'-phosphotransferase [Clostridia bacterium]
MNDGRSTSAAMIESLVAGRFGCTGIPAPVLERIIGRPYITDITGRSRSCVFIFDDMVLKVQRRNEETDNEAAMLVWLRGKLSVPECLAYELKDGIAYTLETRMPGRMLCDGEIMQDPDRAVSIAAEGLKRLQAIDISGCPYTVSRLESRLKAARRRVEAGLVDMDDAEPETWKMFRGPEDLLRWLENSRPDEDLVMTHGDYCMPNIFTDGKETSGFIDLGKCGPADRWQDIAIGYRSLRDNFGGAYTGRAVRPGFRAEELTDLLGIRVDESKLKYYLLLDELF